YKYIVVFRIILYLAARRVQSAKNHLFRIQSAIAQTPLQHLPIRRQNEDAGSVGNPALDLLRALYIDIEQQVVSFAFGLTQEPLCRPVIVSEYVSVFEELIGVDPGL